MHKILLLSGNTKSAFLIQRIVAEGCEARILCRDSGQALDNLVDFCTTPQEALEWEPDLILVDTPGFGPIVKRFREAGIPVIGGGSFSDRMDSNHLAALNFAEASGIPTTEYEEFDDVADASEYVHGKDQPWAMIWGDGQQQSFMTATDLQMHLEKIDAEGATPTRFALMRDYPVFTAPHQKENNVYCCEMSITTQFVIAGFVNPRGVMDPCFGFKVCEGLMDYHQGIYTIEGLTMFKVPLANSVPQLMLVPLAESLNKLSYQGPVFVGCVVEPPSRMNNYESRIAAHRVSLTPPPGFWAAFTKGLEMSLVYFLDRLVNPTRPRTPFEWTSSYVTARKLSVPPYPMTEAPWLEPSQRAELAKFLPDLTLPPVDTVYWNGVRMNGVGFKLVSPVAGYVTGKGESYMESLDAVRNEIRSLRVPWVQARLSPETTFELDMAALQWPAVRQLEEMEEEEEEVETVG